VGKSALLYAFAHDLRRADPTLSVVLVDCRATVAGDESGLKSRAGLVRDLAAASGGLVGLDQGDRETELRRRLRMRRSIVILDAYEATYGGDADVFVRTLGLAKTTCVILGTARPSGWAGVAHELQPLTDDDMIRLIRGLLVERALRQSEIAAVLEATRGLPELGVHAAALLEAGLSAGRVAARVQSDYRDYYVQAIDRLSSSPRDKKVISLLVAVPAPLAADEISDILELDSDATADCLKSLLMERMAVRHDGRYAPRDMLAEVISLVQLDETVIDQYQCWLAAQIGAQATAYSWSRQDVDRCLKLDDHIRAFLRLDEIVLDQNVDDAAGYARLVADLAGWLYSRGYWLELEKASRTVSGVLWTTRNVRALIRLNLLWNLKVLVKRGDGSGVADALRTVATGLLALPADDRTLLAPALVVSAAQSRRFDQRTLQVRPASDIVTRMTHPSTEDVIAAETALLAQGELELVAISRTRRGNIAAENGDPKAAEDLYRAALEIAEIRAYDSWSEEVASVAQGNLGVLMNRQGRWEDALPLLTAAQESLAQVSEQLTVLAEIARAYAKLRRPIAAARAWSQAARLCAALRLPNPSCESDPEWSPGRVVQWFAR
jgi:tetratricopeptide (TPR) repeat protein